MSDILAALSAPFPPETISWRVGSTTKDKTKGMALAYIDARDVQDRLDQICGTNWQVRHPWTAERKLACEIGIKIDGEWIWRGDGAGDSDVEAEKGAFSDSFKRAAVRWGIGRYLYDIDSPWVALEAKGNSYIIAPTELPKLRAKLPRPGVAKPPAPAAAAPDDPEALAHHIKDAIDKATTLRDLNDMMGARGQDYNSLDPRPGSDLAKIKAFSEAAHAFLMDRANKKRPMLANAPPKAA